MNWWLENSIRLRLKTGLQLLENLSDGMNINRAWENIKENIKTSAKESLGLHEFKHHRSRLKCSGYRIQVKAM
jgi:hypothetical protein